MSYNLQPQLQYMTFYNTKKTCYVILEKKMISPQQTRERKRKEPDNAKTKLNMHYKLNFIQSI